MHCNMVDKIHIVKTKAYPTTAEGIAKFYDEWAETYEEVGHVPEVMASTN